MRSYHVLLLAVSLAALSATAQVPGLISHQGKVTVAGTNYTGTGLFRFALVNASGTTTFWSNDGTSAAGSQPAAAVSLAVARGVFSVNLGDTTVANMTQTIPPGAFSTDAVYLRVWFDDGVNGSQLLTPDRRITSVAYALKAGSAPETEPLFTNSVAAAITSGQTNHWTTAFGWGNHASAGYLTNYTETEPLFTNSAAHGIAASDVTAWNAKVSTTRSISTTGPLFGGGDLSANRTLTIAQATGLADGYLANTDWTAFNGKVGSVAATSPLASSGGTTPTITIQTATGSQPGALAAADWTTFNGKVSTTRNLATTTPLTGGGTLAGDLTLSIPQATNTVHGYLSSNDWTTFNGKVSATRTLSTTAPLLGGGTLAGDLTLSLPAATTSANGYLASADWNTFSGKIGGSGTANYVPAFTASGTLGNSALFSAASGNVGIGTSTPNGKLEVIDNGASSGGNTARFYNPSLADAGVHYISIGKSSVNNECALMGFTKQAAISKAWLGVTGDDIIGGIGLTVQKGGNVGIGDNSPAYRFSVFNNISGDYAARIYNGANSGTAHGLLIRAGSNGNPFGSVMIGFQNIDGAAIGSISQNAAFTVSYNTSSDRRLKENITPTHFGLADLMKLQAVDYNFIADASKTPQTGFIAQDLDAVFPDAVTEGGDDAKTKPWSVDYGRVTPLLVKSIQDLKAENDALKAANDVLQAQNADILQRLAAIEAKLGK